MRRAKRSTTWLALAAALLLLAAACGDEVEEWPTQSIRTIITFDPGGGSDQEFMRIGSGIEERLGVDLDNDYVTGGGGSVGWAELVTSEPDGYTVGISLAAHTAIQPLAGDAGYETEDMVIAAKTVMSPAGFLVREDSEWETFDDLIAYIEENPGDVTVGGVDRYSVSDLVTAQFMQESGLEVTYVPLAGGAAGTLADLEGGHVDVAALGSNHDVTTPGARALVLSGDERVPQLPDVPTFTEYGWDVQIFYAWGWAFPAETPQEIVEQFGNAAIEAMEDGGADLALEDGLDPVMMGPDEANDWHLDQAALYEELLPLLQEMDQ